MYFPQMFVEEWSKNEELSINRMSLQIEHIILSVENQSSGNIDYEDEFTDVIILLENGDTYVASFFTYKNIEKQRAAHFVSGEFLNGKYFWADRMVLIENCALENVEEVVNNIIKEGNFFTVFKKL